MTDIHENARLTHNVHVIVGKPRPDGSIEVSTDRRYKNTATRLMTQSLAEFLAGSEHTYNRKHGRPNFISFGTMGIERQPENSEDTAHVEESFDDPTVDPADRTFPWYESTSLALSDTCGAINIDPETKRNIHFWNPQYGWGRPYASQQPYFEGELCTEGYVNGVKLNEPIVKRPPILRADVVTDCPQDLEYGADGYASTVIFYGYASVNWVNSMMHPTYNGAPVGPQLEKMAISEFGLFEKSNDDPNGKYTMFAGFRVPSADDILYVHPDEVILVEWRVTIRALMTTEQVVGTDRHGVIPAAITVLAELIGPAPGSTGNRVHFSATVTASQPDREVDQTVDWTLDTVPSSPDTRIERQSDGTAILYIGATESEPSLHVTAASVWSADVKSTSVVVTSIVSDYVKGVKLTIGNVSESGTEITMYATVDKVGNPSVAAFWTLNGIDGALDEGTTLSTYTTTSATDPTVLTISPSEQCRKLKITAASVADPTKATETVILRVGQTDGSYTISDFTVLTG